MKPKPTKHSAHQPPLFGASLPLRRALNLAILAALYPSFSYANPDGAQIVSGQVSIDTATPGVTTVTNSPNAIINWQNFSVAQNELTQFIQQNSQSAVLNRIIGQNPSEILGQLTSNGKVFLINPNGIVFGANSTVDTQGLIASSLNLSDQDFLTGNYHFIAGSSAGNIVNEGIIRAGKDGNIILIAPQIENNGIIKSDGGSITLAAGQEIIITNLDDPEIRFEIQSPTDSATNLGKLLTEGGAVNVFAGTIKHSGEINADSVQIDKQGNIQLVAQQDITLEADSKISANNSQGDAGSVRIESKSGTTLAYGTIEAKATQTGTGGKIELLGEQVGVLDQAVIDASGENGGGEVLIGGDYQGKNAAVHNAKATYIGENASVKADAQTAGDGGKIIAWSDEATRVYGDISAQGGSQSGNGGFIETSGHWLDTAGIRVNASSAHGQAGEWLLDPYNITIVSDSVDVKESINSFPNWTASAGPSYIRNSTINAQLNSGTSITIYTGGGTEGTDVGNITVSADITKTSGGDATLNLKADNDIIIDSGIGISSTSNKLNVIFEADYDNSNAGDILLGIDSFISTNGGDLNLNTTGMITNDADLDAENITFKANKMALEGGKINGKSSVKLFGTNAIDLGTTATGDLLNTLELSSFEISTITTPVLRIGDVSSGAIDIKSPLSLADFDTTLNLTSGGAITQQAGATIAISSLNVSGASVTLTEANPVGVISGSASSGDFRYRSSNLLTISTVDGISGITVPTTSTIALESDTGVNQQAEANLIGGSLALKTKGSVELFNSGNYISKVAADLSWGGLGSGSFGLFSGTDLIVDSLLSADGSTWLQGITTNNQPIRLTSNGLSINQSLNAGTSTVDIETDTLAWDTAGNGNVVGNQVDIRPYTTARPITIGAACIGGSGTCLSITELWRIMAPTIGIGSRYAGDIFVDGITSGVSTLTDRNAKTTRIGLITNGGISQSTTAINVQDLGIEANGEVLLDAANNITNLAARTLGQNFTFNSGQDFNIVQLSGSTAAYDNKSKYRDNYNINGINVCSSPDNCGDVTLTSTGAISSSSAPITATNLTVNSGGDVTLAGQNLVSGILDIIADGNIYSRTKGVSQISRLNAANGSIDVENIGGFILGSTDFNQGTTVVKAFGNITVKAMSPLTVNGEVISTNGTVSLTASNGDTLSINAPLSAAGGIALEGGTLTGNNSGSVTQFFKDSTPDGTTGSTSGGTTTGTTTDSTDFISTALTDSTQQNTAVVVGTTSQTSTELDITNSSTTNSTNTANTTDESTEFIVKKQNSKQCTK
ncbi:MAG: two-partner secretion domain-containing protein [Methylobacter sp.]